jgi:hypothetical protein
MTEIVLSKAGNGVLIPLDQQSHDFINKLKSGVGLSVSVKRHNNPAFHRKLFALFNLAFEAWEPDTKEYNGEKVSKNFDQFRNDITVLAGFYEASVNFKNEVRLTAKSLNFSAMEQDEREKLYSAVLDVVLQRVLTRYTKDDLENVINQLLGFA